jgi:hypothetical protein
MLKRKSLLLILLAILLVSSACTVLPNPFNFETSPTPTAVRNVLATYQPRPTVPALLNQPAATPIPASPLAIQATATRPLTVLAAPTPLLTPDSRDGFCCLRFAPGPFAQTSESFPAGTEIVYAIWDYAGLLPEDRIRRIWIRDNLIWITREEQWNWDNYGAQGTVRDLSIFDYEGSGLQPAEYRLQLYLNDELQQESVFVIAPP